MSTDVAVPEPPDGLDDERAKQVAQAYHLYIVEDHKLEDVAAMMKISRTQVWRLAQECKAQVALIPWLAKEEMRMKHTMRLRAMTSWIFSHAEVEGISPLDAVPVLLKVMEREAKMHGLDAPTRVELGGEGKTPNPRVIEALREQVEKAGEDRL